AARETREVHPASAVVENVIVRDGEIDRVVDEQAAARVRSDHVVAYDAISAKKADSALVRSDVVAVDVDLSERSRLVAYNNCVQETFDREVLDRGDRCQRYEAVAGCLRSVDRDWWTAAIDRDLVSGHRRQRRGRFDRPRS